MIKDLLRDLWVKRFYRFDVIRDSRGYWNVLVTPRKGESFIVGYKSLSRLNAMEEADRWRNHGHWLWRSC